MLFTGKQSISTANMVRNHHFSDITTHLSTLSVFNDAITQLLVDGGVVVAAANDSNGSNGTTPSSALMNDAALATHSTLYNAPPTTTTVRVLPIQGEGNPTSAMRWVQHPLCDMLAEAQPRQPSTSSVHPPAAVRVELKMSISAPTTGANGATTSTTAVDTTTDHHDDTHQQQLYPTHLLNKAAYNLYSGDYFAALPEAVIIEPSSSTNATAESSSPTPTRYEWLSRATSVALVDANTAAAVLRGSSIWAPGIVATSNAKFAVGEVVAIVTPHPCKGSGVGNRHSHNSGGNDASKDAFAANNAEAVATPTANVTLLPLRGSIIPMTAEAIAADCKGSNDATTDVIINATASSSTTAGMVDDEYLFVGCGLWAMTRPQVLGHTDAHMKSGNASAQRADTKAKAAAKEKAAAAFNAPGAVGGTSKRAMRRAEKAAAGAMTSSSAVGTPREEGASAHDGTMTDVVVTTKKARCENADGSVGAAAVVTSSSDASAAAAGGTTHYDVTTSTWHVDLTHEATANNVAIFVPPTGTVYGHPSSDLLPHLLADAMWQLSQQEKEKRAEETPTSAQPSHVDVLPAVTPFLQNLSSMVPALLLTAAAGGATDNSSVATRRHYLDACAAPGGKTSHLTARLLQQQAAATADDNGDADATTTTATIAGASSLFSVYACDRSASRAKSLAKLLTTHYGDGILVGGNAGGGNKKPAGVVDSTSTAAVTAAGSCSVFMGKDVADWLKGLPTPLTTSDKPSTEASSSPPSKANQQQLPSAFNGILLDPPCTGLGLRPRVTAHQHSRDDIVQSADYQANLFRACLGRLVRMEEEEISSSSSTIIPPRLVYSTCTIAHEENEGNVLKFLEWFNNNNHETDATSNPSAKSTYRIRIAQPTSAIDKAFMHSPLGRLGVRSVVGMDALVAANNMNSNTSNNGANGTNTTTTATVTAHPLMCFRFMPNPDDLLDGVGFFACVFELVKV